MTWAWKLAALAAALGAVWGHGNMTGRAAQEAAHARAVAVLESRLDASARRAALAESRRLDLERERDDLRSELDTAAAGDPDAGRRALGADSMRRINSVGRAN